MNGVNSLYFKFSALTVRFITRRFIGEYDPTLGKLLVRSVVASPEITQKLK